MSKNEEGTKTETYTGSLRYMPVKVEVTVKGGKVVKGRISTAGVDYSRAVPEGGEGQ